MDTPQTKTCRHCGLTLPLSEFEQLPTGTYRRVCRRCKYILYDRPARERNRFRRLGIEVLPRSKDCQDNS